MSEKPASLLTKTQRRRLADGFEGVDGAKRRRDQRRIRERVAAGLTDFEHLAGYPDDQLELALSDLDDDRLRRTLAEMRLVGERVRLLHDVERAAVVETAREQAAAGDVDSLGRVDLQTPAEHRAAAERAAAERARPSPWLHRAETLLKVGLLFFAATVAVELAVPGAMFGPTGGLAALVGAATVIAGLATFLGGLGIVVLRGVKHDLVPVLAALADDPVGAVQRTWERL